jgi:ubiquinone/menaquinone biosynthesis C-methylase UbiE
MGSFFIMNYYNTIATSYEQLHREEQLNKLKIIKENLDLTEHLKNPTILDIGCGPCWSTEFFDNVIGIDSAEQLLDGNKDVLKASAEQLPFPDNCFDIILCVTAIHHFELSKAIPEMKRVAKRNAQFVITVLKKSAKAKFITTKLKRNFTVKKIIGNRIDFIFLLER